MFLEPLTCTSIILWLSSHPQQIFKATTVGNCLVGLKDATEISSSECLMLFLMQDCSFDSLGISSVAVYLFDTGNAQMF